ncbi:hypothetical protein [Croceicoccus marinus]|uniref:Uncharacterized protein n=1 Tax=Croceicoccus marinus TaxID=450378 RepID=A0A217EYV6_9SPHN|nr:hypothetical protein [Croceicoccus marinus]ARU18315.1 hypothetical protein A9D14_18345 [Croceicoccus marinus]
MMKPKLDEIARCLLARVTEYELEKAEYRQRYNELETKALQQRNTKEAACEAYQARQAKKHPDLMSTSTKASKRAAERRLQKAQNKAWIAMVDDWKCRLIAEIAAEEVAVFAEIEGIARGPSDATTLSPDDKPKARAKKSKPKIRPSQSVPPDAVAEGAETPDTQPSKSSVPEDLTFEERRSEAPSSANEKPTDAGSNVWPHGQSASSARGSNEQEILPPLSGENEQSDIEQEDLF